MILLKFPVTVEEFAAEQERITGIPTQKNGLEIYEAWVPELNGLYESGVKKDLDHLLFAFSVLDQARERKEIGAACKHTLDVLGRWAEEAYIQGREA